MTTDGTNPTPAPTLEDLERAYAIAAIASNRANARARAADEAAMEAQRAEVQAGTALANHRAEHMKALIAAVVEEGAK